MPSKNTKFYSLILIGLDFVVLMAVFFIAYYVRTQIDHRDLLHTVYASDYLLGFVVIAPVWIILYASLGLYSASVYSRRLVEWGRLLLGTFMGILLVIGWEYGTRMYIFPARLVAMYVFLGSFLAIGTVRELFRLTRSWLFQYNHGVNRVMVIGTSLATRDIAESISTTYKSGFRVVAMAGPKRFVPPGLDVVHFASLDPALAQIKELKIDTIIQTNLYENEEKNQKVLGAAQVNHIQYNFIPGEPEFYTGKNTIDVFLGYPMITVSQTPLIGWGEIAKRIFDTIISGILLIVLAPLFVLTLGQHFISQSASVATPSRSSLSNSVVWAHSMASKMRPMSSAQWAVMTWLKSMKKTARSNTTHASLALAIFCERHRLMNYRRFLMSFVVI